VIGAALGGALTNRFGRRKLIILAGIIFTLSGVGAASAPSVGWLIAGGVISGAGIGLASFVSPMHFAELAPLRLAVHGWW
jgi:MFS family permease